MKNIIKFKIKRILILVCVVFFCVAAWHVWKPLPQGVSVVGGIHTLESSQVRFLRDHTYVDSSGVSVKKQEIFDEVFSIIDDAQDFIVIDMFLFNDFLGRSTFSYRALSGELAQRLIDKKIVSPDITIIFITDPINHVYGGDSSTLITSLRTFGINVVETDLRQLRDSNPLYSGLWRSVFAWWGNSTSGGFLPHIMDARRPKITLRTYLRLLNFKANHRKIMVAGSASNTATTLITSANPHDGSSAHSNVGLVVLEKRSSSGLWQDVIFSEQAVAAFSDSDAFEALDVFMEPTQENVGDDSLGDDRVTLQLLTEKKIKQVLLEDINRSGGGDAIDMLMFYISDRDVVRALVRAANRGATIRLVFDPNKDAFGREKNGIPNRQVAHDLIEKTDNISVRWCLTNGEQCHSKITLFTYNSGERLLHVGSANLTRRNIGNYNLEANIVVRSQSGSSTAITDATNFFESVWTNKDGKFSSVDYDVYADDNRFRVILYSIMEATGMSSF